LRLSENCAQSARVLQKSIYFLIALSGDCDESALVCQAGYAAWLANPIIVAAWLFYLRDKRSAALISAVLALGLTLTFLWVADVPLSDKLSPVTVKIISYGSGYWLWIASAGILVAGVSINLLLFRYVASGSR
jgi:hypothetical protein